MPFECKYSCSDCGNVFSVITENKPKGRCPSCPQCKKSNYPSLKSTTKSNKTYTQAELDKNVEDIVISRKAPSVGGTSNFNKAWDATQEMVAVDYQMTDLNTNLRAGDSMAPKLRPDLEQQVDQVFKTNKPIMGQNAAVSLNKSLTAQINAGKYTGQSGNRDITQRVQNSGYKVPTTELFSYDNRGKPN